MRNRFPRAPGWRAIGIFLTGAAILILALPFPAKAEQTSARDSTATLNKLVAEALAQNPDVVAAQARWQATTYAPIQARTLPDPEVQLQEFTVGSPQPFSGYETSNFYYTGFGVSQDIPGPGKLALQGKIAEKDAEIARHQYEMAQRGAAEKVREDYFELFYLAKTLELLQRSQTDLSNIEQTVQGLYRVGQAQAQDVLKAQLEATRMLDEIEHNHLEMQQRQDDLKTALGRASTASDIEIGDVRPTKVSLASGPLTDLAERRSPDVQMERASRERSEESLRLAQKGYLPDFTAGYAYEKTGPGFPDYYMLTLGARIPLYFWRRQTPAIEQAALDAAAAHAQMRARMLDASASAQDQLVAIHIADRVLTLYREGLIPQGENSLGAATAGYRVGKVDFESVLSAFVDLRNLHEEYYREIADHEIAVARLEQTIGDLK